MRKWEEIVKDKLEGYESPLPEGHLADFRARREKADKHRRRFPWVGAVAVAVAASLAALFFLWKPAVPEEDVRVAEGDVRVMEGDVRVAEVTPDVSAAPSRPRPLLARADAKTSTEEKTSAEEKTPVDAKKPAEEAPVTDILQTPPSPQTPAPPQTTPPPQTPPSPQTPAPPKAAGEPAAGAAETVTPASPFIPQATPARPVRLNVGAAAGIVAGGGLLAGVLTPLVGRSVSVLNPVSNNYTNGGPTPPTTNPGPDSTNGGQGGTEPGPDSTNGSQGGQGGQGGTDPGTEPGTAPGTNPSIGKADGTDVLQEAATHYFPLKLGLSAWIPLTERLQITTGVQYSLYSSRIAGEFRQNAHYLGIPVRLDWTFAQSRWLDVYLGGGVEGAFCAGATLDGQRISGDGFSLSLLGAGGIQFNMSRHVGLYAEPQISWRIPMGTPVLQTYRSTHPLMFSVETGIRINLK